MIWTTWRQYRTEAAVGTAILAALAAALIILGLAARTRAHGLGLSVCRARCSDAINQLHADFHSMPPFISALVAVPLLAAMFWAAPLVAREYEAGTHRLAWTQSISPTRWITTKIIVIFGLAAGAALGLGLLATWTLDPLDAAFGGRYNSTWYDIQGIVPVACMLFALAAGVAASALLRRTIPAMAVTLATYAVTRFPMHWIRWHFAPLTTRTTTTAMATLLQNPTGSPWDLATSAVPTGGWLHAVTVTDNTGQRISSNRGNFDLLRDHCPNLQIDASRNGILNPASCAKTVHSLSLHTAVTYQSASHFWLIQTVESLIFVTLAGLLTATAVLAVKRPRIN